MLPALIQDVGIAVSSGHRQVSDIGGAADGARAGIQNQALCIDYAAVGERYNAGADSCQCDQVSQIWRSTNAAYETASTDDDTGITAGSALQCIRLPFSIPACDCASAGQSENRALVVNRWSCVRRQRHSSNVLVSPVLMLSYRELAVRPVVAFVLIGLPTEPIPPVPAVSRRVAPVILLAMSPLVIEPAAAPDCRVTEVPPFTVSGGRRSKAQAQ